MYFFHASFSLHPIGAAIVLLLCTAAGLAHGQPAGSAAATPPQAADAPDAAAPTLGTVTVTGNPLGAADDIPPTERLQGDALLLRSQSTLGETLQGLPGVGSTYFGPNASRPVIRGQDGDRIRILANGGAAPDASALSFDHAVPTDALTTERIEVLRGPSALQYGGSAVGGVVNVIDNRIPTEPFAAEGEFGGRADAGYASGSRERSGGFVVEGGNDRFVLHADAFGRRAGDVNVPAWLECTRPGSPAWQRRMCNSASRSDGGALGGTAFLGGGNWIGASVSDYRSNYGTVSEDSVSIGMRSRRYALEGKWKPGGFFSSVHLKASHTDYRHTEYEGAMPGTTFSNAGNDLRIEARHRGVAALGGLEGVIGLQSESTRFAADGQEAFAPHSRTRSTAVFIYEELPMRWGRLNFGARTEQVRVRSLGGFDDAGGGRFVVGERRFNPHSAAAGALVKLSPQWQLTGNLAYTERAPKDYELFANGPHIATGAWEVGDPTLSKERSLGADIGAQWKSGPHRVSVNAYWTRFRNYIGLVGTGHVRDGEGRRDPTHDHDHDHGEDGDASGAKHVDLHEALLGEYVYRGMRARFTGLEASGTVRLLGSEGLRPWGAAGSLDLEWRGDLVRATNLDTGEPLPRISPARLGGTLVWSAGPWSARMGVDRFAAQHRVPSLGQRETAGYTLWNAALSYQMKAGRSHLLWYARLDNLSNALAYNATSILTTTAYPKAPLPGRSLKVGVRVTF